MEVVLGAQGGEELAKARHLSKNKATQCWSANTKRLCSYRQTTLRLSGALPSPLGQKDEVGGIRDARYVQPAALGPQGRVPVVSEQLRAQR